MSVYGRAPGLDFIIAEMNRRNEEERVRLAELDRELERQRLGVIDLVKVNGVWMSPEDATKHRS
jgi:hypothetical protein